MRSRNYAKLLTTFGLATVLVAIGACSTDTTSGSGETERSGSVSQAVLTALGTFTSGSTVEIQYTNMGNGSPSSGDWIAISKPGYADSVYLKWKWTNGTASGSLFFEGLAPGQYEARAFYNWPTGGYTQGQAAATFTISASAAAPVVTPSTPGPNQNITVAYSGFPGYATDWISIEAVDPTPGPYLRWKYTNGATSGSVVFPGLTAGTYVARAYYNYAETQSLEIRAEQTFTVGAATGTPTLNAAASVTPNTAIPVTFAGFPGNATDWIAIAPAGSPSTTVTNWQYLNGQTSGTITLPGVPAGSYELRGFFNHPTGGNTIQASRAITVAPTTNFGPTHTFVGLTGTHFITQGGCSPSGTLAGDAEYFCQHFYNATCHALPGFVAHTLTTSTGVKMHKLNGCTTQGLNIPNTTCAGGPCKIGNWSEVTSGVSNIVCSCGS